MERSWNLVEKRRSEWQLLRRWWKKPQFQRWMALVGMWLERSVESDGVRVDAEPQNVNPAVLESAKVPHFHGLSENLKNCDSEDSKVQNLPASGSSSELSAHQMPKILHAERSSNASSAFQLGGSSQDPWEQASRESYNSLVDGGLLPGSNGDVFVRLAQKARPAQKRIQKRIASMSPMELGQDLHKQPVYVQKR